MQLDFLRIIFIVLLITLLQACTANGKQQGVHVTAWMPPMSEATGKADSSSTRTQEYWPLPRTQERPTPLHFGLFVTPDPSQNPIDPPERFMGFHAATDFELLPGEDAASVPVFAICDGRIVFSGFAGGYGGLLIQSCTIASEEVTVLYGHLQIDALPKVGKQLQAGKQISILADARSRDAGGNRKHLHLSIHRGPQLDLRGYVQREDALRGYVDPQTVLPIPQDSL